MRMKPMTPEEVSAAFAKAEEVLKNVPVEVMTVSNTPAPPEDHEMTAQEWSDWNAKRMAEAFGDDTPAPPEPKSKQLVRELRAFRHRGLSNFTVQIANEAADELAIQQARIAELETANSERKPAAIVICGGSARAILHLYDDVSEADIFYRGEDDAIYFVCVESWTWHYPNPKE